MQLCGDYKVTINQALQVDRYPLPNPSNLFASLTGGQKFTKLDLTSVYQQVPLDEASSELVTINTHQGLYKYTWLPFGVASPPAVFQRIMDTMLQGISHVICYLDDILVMGTSDAEHLCNLSEVLRRLQGHGARLSKEKCSLFQDSIEYLGHAIDSLCIHTSQKKVRTILEAPPQRNLQHLRSFLGLLNYYTKFLTNLSAILHLLHRILQAGQAWPSSTACEKAFQSAKQQLVGAPILAHFDSEIPIVLAAYVSVHGIGAIMSHRLPHGSERPVAFASRTLSDSEKNYSQVEMKHIS